MAWKRGFYRLPVRTQKRKGVACLAVVTLFAIYLTGGMVLAPLLARLVLRFDAMHAVPPSPFSLFVVQLVVWAVVCVLFVLFLKTLNREMVRAIWKDTREPWASSVGWDLAVGAMTWFVGFPVVAAIGEISDLFLRLFLGFESYEQVAVRYLKQSLQNPELLAVALVTILVLAPILEELLFRGFLQTYLRGICKRKWAIVITSALFALFHLSWSQGIGNISLVLSLFSFSLFLGFVYERQASLFASIALHMVFNGVSVARVLL